MAFPERKKRKRKYVLAQLVKVKYLILWVYKQFIEIDEGAENDGST